MLTKKSVISHSQNTIMFVLENNMCKFAFKLGIFFYLKLCIILFGVIETVHSSNLATTLENLLFICKNKEALSCVVAAQLISALQCLAELHLHNVSCLVPSL